MTDVATAPPPGWYADPALPAQQRWWSGIGWTDHVQGPSMPLAPAPAASVPAAPGPASSAPIAPPPVAPEAITPEAPVEAPTEHPAGTHPGSVPLGTPLPQSMTTEEQLSWHRDAGPAMTNPALDGFGGTSGAPLARGFAPQGAQPFGHGQSRHYGFQAAPPIENKPAKSGLILSLVSLLINPLLIIGIIGIVKGGQGLNRARQIESMGYYATRRGSATAAVLVGILSTLWWAASIVLGVTTYLAVSGYHHEVVERSIAQSVEQQSGVPVTVVCPKIEPTAAGTTFECTVTGSNGAIAYAQVKFTDSSGHFLANITTTSTAGTPADSSGTS